MSKHIEIPDFSDSAPDLTCGITAGHDLLDLKNVREAIEGVFRANPGDFPCYDLQCACGVMHEVPGRWFLVADILERVPLLAPQVYFRCHQCGGISIPDGFDQLAGKMDFFQIEAAPSGGPPIVNCITYDLGGLDGIMRDAGVYPKGDC